VQLRRDFAIMVEDRSDLANRASFFFYLCRTIQMISKHPLFSFQAQPLGLTILALALVFGAGTNVMAQDSPDFEKTIKPIFEKHCMACHGPIENEDESNDFRIDERDDVLDWIGEGSAEDSDFYAFLISDDEDELMPPPEHSKLNQTELDAVKTWIDGDTNWPEDAEFVDRTADLKVPQETEIGNKADPGAQDPAKTQASSDDSDSAEPKDTEEDSVPAGLTDDQKSNQVFRAIGSLHTAAVHLPIGLLLASGIFAFLSLRGNFVMSDCAYYCLWLGTLGAIVACLTGWWYSDMEHRGAVTQFTDLFDQNQDIFWHRTGGLIVTAVAFLLALFAAGARNRDPDDGMLWKVGLILLAGGIGWVGHTGGELAYPKGYKDLEGLYNRLIGNEDPAEKAPPAVKPEEAGKAPVVGETSGESED
jgi:uncharacterized membrane protein